MIMDNRRREKNKNQAKLRLLRLCMNGDEWEKMIKWWRWRDLNPRPKDYDSSALPLSYTATEKGYLDAVLCRITSLLSR